MPAKHRRGGGRAGVQRRRHHGHGGGGGIGGVLVGAATGLAVGAALGSAARPPPPPPQHTTVVIRETHPAQRQPVVVGNPPPRREPSNKPPPPGQPFLISHVTIPSFERYTDAVHYVVVVTAVDGASYSVKRRYSAFDKFHSDYWRHYSSLRVAPPPKSGLRTLFGSLTDMDLEQRRQGLLGYFSSVVDYARSNKVKRKLRQRIEEFLEFHVFYRTVEKPQVRADVQSPDCAVIAVPVAVAAPASAPEAKQEDARPSTMWEVEPFKQDYDDIFTQNDPKGQGKLSPTTVRDILIQTKLSNDVLAQIWELADIDKDGFLDSEEFALAMFLAKIAENDALPDVLPMTYVPPSKRMQSLTRPLPNPFT